MHGSNCFSGRKIAVIGMARSGLAAADVLSARGAHATLYDGKPAQDLSAALAFATARGIAVRTGAEAVDADEDLVVTSPGVRRDAPILLDAVRRGLPVWGEIEAAYAVARAPILAITGTNGKTTTTALLGRMVQRAGVKTFVAGNIAAGSLAMPLIRAADEAPENAAIVAEISSFQLEWTHSFRPVAAALLNITLDHADRQTWDEYVASKWKIFANQRPGDTAVLRSDVPRPAAQPEIRAETIFYDLLERPSWLSQIRLPGEHNRENVMAALALARSFGIGEEPIRAEAIEFAGVVHRLEYVADCVGARWYNNSMCTNNDAFARSLAAIDGPKIVIAGGVYKGGDTAQFGAAASQESVRALICYGRSGDLLCAAAHAAGAARTEIVAGLGDAVRLAASLAEGGDSVLLSPACASFDQFKDFEDRGEQFKSLVRSLDTSHGEARDAAESQSERN